MPNGPQARKVAARPPRLPELVANQMQEYVLSQNLKPGDKLPTEPEMSEMYEVSRQVVREAARVLEQRGLVEIRAGRGMSVAEVNVDRVHDIYRLFLQFKPENFEDLLAARLILEPAIAAIAAKQRTEADMERIRRPLEASRNLPADAFDEHLTLDLEFHREVTLASHNPFLIALSAPINEFLRDVYEEPIAYLSSLPQTHEEHQQILDALADQNPEAAHEATTNHLTRVRVQGPKLIPKLLSSDK